MTVPFSQDLFVEVHRNATAGSVRPPLVLIHGAGGLHLAWPPTLRRLPDTDVYAVDLPGHGASPGPALEIADNAAGLTEWITSAGLAPPVVCGHSMGSAIALTMGLGWPGRVAGLVLIGSGTRLPVNPWLLEATADPKQYAEAVDKITRWSFARGASGRMVELIRQQLAATPVGNLHADLATCDRFDIETQVHGLQIPALVLCGSDDRMTPPAASEALAAAIPDAELHLVEGAGHTLMLERPEETCEHVSAFLERLSRR